MGVEIVKISEILDKEFFVPAYQRGYRWTKEEVTALLDDVQEFNTQNETLEYCIQPLIVKENGSQWEVVDGQQRLTTIYIILKVAKQLAIAPFTLSYETRNNSKEFLYNLPASGEIDKSNVDYFHITTARNAVNDWLDTQSATTKFPRSIVLNKLVTKLISSVVFIWYDIGNDVEPIKMFEKVNLGKIPLTNAELIKALLLSKDNLGVNASALQKEISIAWDKIEHKLQNNSFWYFFNNKKKADENEGGTRIDKIFDILSLQPNHTNPKFITSDKRSYLTFAEELGKATYKNQYIQTLWNEVEKLYSDLCYWYDDVDTYHLFGFIIYTKLENIDTLILDISNKKKSEVQKRLMAKIVKRYKYICDNSNNLAGLGYEKAESVRYILLLFNIATLICKSGRETRFPFDLYKKCDWDIEHIHATADDTQEADDELWNLTLLSADINRSYGNSPFNQKRSVIIEEYGKDGKFLPTCTRNVFLKAYTKDVSKTDMTKWEDKDKQDYLNSIVEMLTVFTERGKNNG